MRPKTIKFPNLKENEMMIAAYVEPRMYYPDNARGFDVTLDEAFDDMEDAGINTLINTFYFLNLDGDDIIMDIIERLEKRNMSLLVRDHDITKPRTYEEDLVHFKNNFEKLEKYKAYAGLHVVDEPGIAEFDMLERMRKAYKTLYPDKLFYVNLLQTYAPGWAIANGASYDFNAGGGLPDDNDIENYYKVYIEKVKADVFSYDFYPLKGEFPKVIDGYFRQLHLSYKYGKAAGVPVFNFIQCSVFGEGTRRLTLNELMWQVNTALAYNTKGIAWFTYWIFHDLPQYGQGFIDWKGNKTKTYYNGKKVNDFIKRVDEYVLNAEMRGYRYSGVMPNGEVPDKEEQLESFGSLKSFGGGNLFIGCFDYYVSDEESVPMYYVVNNDIVNNVKAELEFSDKKRLKLVDGEKIRVFTDCNRLTTYIPAGFAVIVIEEN